MAKQIRVGMIGCGAITQRRHAPEYAANPAVEIVGFYDYQESRARELSGKFGGNVYGDVDSMIQDETIDAVSVCTPNNSHASISIQAMRAGKHVLCEKPMALSVDQTREMLKAQNATGMILMPGHNQRLIPTHLKARELLQDGAIGKPLFVQCSFKHAGPESWSIDNSSQTWFFSKEKSSLGVFGDLGSHKIDLIRFLMREEIDAVFATIMTLDKTYPDGTPIDLEDNAMCQFRLESGIPGIMHFSWTNYGQEDNSTVIYGDKGAMKIFGDYADDIVLEMRDGTSIKYSVSRMSTNETQLKSGVIDEFVSAILENREPIVTARDGHNTMAVITSGLKSASQGQWIEVKYE